MYALLKNHSRKNIERARIKPYSELAHCMFGITINYYQIIIQINNRTT